MNRGLMNRGQEFVWNLKSECLLKITKVHVRVAVVLFLLCYCAPPTPPALWVTESARVLKSAPTLIEWLHGVSISFSWNRNNMLVAVRETCQRCLTEVLIKQHGMGPRVKPRQGLVHAGQVYSVLSCTPSPPNIFGYSFESLIFSVISVLF